MKKPQAETRVDARRDFLKLCAGAGALSVLNACTGGGADQAAGPAPAQPPVAEAAANDAKQVVWEMPQSKRPPIAVDVHAHWAPPSFSNAQSEVGGGRGSSR